MDLVHIDLNKFGARSSSMKIPDRGLNTKRCLGLSSLRCVTLRCFPIRYVCFVLLCFILRRIDLHALLCFDLHCSFCVAVLMEYLVQNFFKVTQPMPVTINRREVITILRRSLMYVVQVLCDSDQKQF